jgi:hypothetical protein
MTQNEQNYQSNSAHLLGGIMGIAASLRIYANDPEMLQQKLRELHGLTEFGWACLYLDPQDFRQSVYYAAVDRAKADEKGAKMLAHIADYSDEYTLVYRCPDAPTISGAYMTKTLKFAMKLQQFLEADSIDAFREACFRELIADKIPTNPVV